MTGSSSSSLLDDVRMRWTVAQYERAGEAGVFDPGPRVELIEGEVVTVSPIGPSHANARRVLQEAASDQVDRRTWTVGSQDPVRLSDFSEPEPDLWVARGPRPTYEGRHPTPADLALVVEIADSSLVPDRALKVPAYAAAGVGHLWLVAIPERTVTVYSSPAPAQRRYRKVTELGAGDTLSDRQTGLALPVADLF